MVLPLLRSFIEQVARYGLGTAGSFGAASARTLRPEIDSGCHMKTGFKKIDSNRFCFFNEIFVNDVGKTFNGK